MGKVRFIKKHVFCQCKFGDVKNHAFRKTAIFLVKPTQQHAA